MKMYLRADKTLEEVKQEFNGHFPSLKIEFFYKPNDISASQKKQILPPEKTLREIGYSLEYAMVDLSENMRVSEFEQMFKDDFNLPIQLYRKVGEGWMETSNTDQLTIKKQNSLAE